MKQAARVVLVLGLVVLTAACQRFSGARNYAAPLPATPTTPVGAGPLQPLDPNAPPPGTPVTDPQTVASVDLAENPVSEPAGALDVGRSDMLGGWKLTSSGDNCMAFMTLTTWTGGYRANTRGCSTPLLTGISAWDLSGKQIVLKDGGGAVVAQLFATSAEQFNGQTSTGSPVSLYR
ncbi:MAG: protease inhibitor Inh/omp19 family protein [Roseibium sp.]|nr:protease inhibitor Inh/omp19 family protein [Roseibium sp.]